VDIALWGYLALVIGRGKEDERGVGAGVRVEHVDVLRSDVVSYTSSALQRDDVETADKS
jgi:hypothetical protein